MSRGIDDTLPNPRQPWPDNPLIPEIPRDSLDDEGVEESEEEEYERLFGSRRFEEPDEDDIFEQNILMLGRQRLFRWAAQVIAMAASELAAVQRVAAFGAVANPLIEEIPRFSEYRRHRIAVFHECDDLDLAFWLTSFDNLNELRKAIKRGMSLVEHTRFGGVAHHQVDSHLFEGTRYRGRLCGFNECPKPKKRECLVPGCGAKRFLRQFEDYHFNEVRFEKEPKVILFDREKKFLVHVPKIELYRP